QGLLRSKAMRELERVGRVWLWACAVTALVCLTAAGQERPARPTEKARDRLAAVTVSLAESYRAYLDIARTYWDPGEELTARAVIFPVSASDLSAGRLKGNWERMAAGLAQRSGTVRQYAILVSVHDEAARKAVWTGEYDLDPEPLAKAARELVPD